MPPGPRKMVVGFNHNIKYRGQTYHAQTEDTGTTNPQVVTHLFLGGNIVASKRTSYADISLAENLPDVVRALMEEQHKEVLRNLVHGVYDDPARDGAPPRAFPAAPPAGATPSRAAPAGRTPARASSQPAREQPPPREQPVEPENTLFGDDLISERSLDEVILAYLAGEDGGRKR